MLSKMPLYPLPLVPSGCTGRQAHQQCPFILTCRSSEKSYGGRSVPTLGKEEQCENRALCVVSVSVAQALEECLQLLSASALGHCDPHQFLFLCHNCCCQVPHVGDIELKPCTVSPHLASVRFCSLLQDGPVGRCLFQMSPATRLQKVKAILPVHYRAFPNADRFSPNLLLPPF